MWRYRETGRMLCDDGNRLKQCLYEQRNYKDCWSSPASRREAWILPQKESILLTPHFGLLASRTVRQKRKYQCAWDTWQRLLIAHKYLNILFYYRTLEFQLVTLLYKWRAFQPSLQLDEHALFNMFLIMFPYFKLALVAAECHLSNFNV